MSIKPLKNEKELLNDLSTGNERAFSAIFMAYHNGIGEYVYNLCQSKEIAQEVIQDVFLKIWENRAHLIHIEKFTSYLFILTKNHTLNVIRKKVNDERKLNVFKFSGDQEPDFIEEYDKEDYEFVMEKVVSKLPPQQQKVFLMRIAGLKNPEIADKLCVSIESVKKYQCVALKTVSDYLRQYKLEHLVIYTILLII